MRDQKSSKLNRILQFRSHPCGQTGWREVRGREGTSQFLARNSIELARGERGAVHSSTLPKKDLEKQCPAGEKLPGIYYLFWNFNRNSGREKGHFSARHTVSKMQAPNVKVSPRFSEIARRGVGGKEYHTSQLIAKGNKQAERVSLKGKRRV